MRSARTHTVLAVIAALTVTASCASDDDTGAPAMSEVSAPTTPATTLVTTATASVASTAAPSTTARAAQTYVSTSFVVPFEVTPPDWLPAGTDVTESRPDFLTWAPDGVDRAVRFLVPAVMEGPGGTTTEVPDDYRAYLLAQRDVGATFDDIVETTVDGRPTTIVTATTSGDLNHSLGCEQPPYGECWSLLPDVVLRIAVIDTGDRTLLVWERDLDDSGAAVDYRSFDTMLATLRFRDDVVPSTEPPAAVDLRLPEGIYRTPELTRQQLVDTGVAAGYDQASIEAALDAEQIATVVYGLRLADGGWLQLYQNNGGTEGVGWRGAYQLVDDDTVIATETATGCAITYNFQLDGDQLTLDVVDDTCGEIDLAIQTLIFESAPFTLDEA